MQQVVRGVTLLKLGRPEGRGGQTVVQEWGNTFTMPAWVRRAGRAGPKHRHSYHTGKYLGANDYVCVSAWLGPVHAAFDHVLGVRMYPPALGTSNLQLAPRPA